MDRPYIICHMVISIDGKVTGGFLSKPECAEACEIYYRINREMKADGFICGRVTMESSFTGGWYPDLDKYEPVSEKCDYLPSDIGGRYAIAFDSLGRLGWRSSVIVDPDGDPGYDGARIVEVLTEKVDRRYLAYLRKMKIPYVFAGVDSIDVSLALKKLRTSLFCEILLLEGGSIINGAFLRADAVDEISLVVAPLIGDLDGKPLFMDSEASELELMKSEALNGCILLNYRKTSKTDLK